MCAHICCDALQYWVVWILWDSGELCWSDSYSPAPMWTSTQQTESAENHTIHVWIFWPAGRCLKLVMLGDIRLHFDSNSDHNMKSLKSLFPTLHLAQRISVPTQHRGHTLDWLIASEDISLWDLEVIDKLLSDQISSSQTILSFRLNTFKLWLLGAVSSVGFQRMFAILHDSMRNASNTNQAVNCTKQKLVHFPLCSLN